ncbi:hypothetical protein BDV09DRAFT_99211 [Aspergillus tetrazonus]
MVVHYFEMKSNFTLPLTSKPDSVLPSTTKGGRQELVKEPNPPSAPPQTLTTLYRYYPTLTSSIHNVLTYIGNLQARLNNLRFAHFGDSFKVTQHVSSCWSAICSRHSRVTQGYARGQELLPLRRAKDCIQRSARSGLDCKALEQNQSGSLRRQRPKADASVTVKVE